MYHSNGVDDSRYTLQHGDLEGREVGGNTSPTHSKYTIAHTMQSTHCKYSTLSAHTYIYVLGCSG